MESDPKRPDFPEYVRPLVEQLRTATGTHILLREEFLSGKSGAFVGLVDCQGHHDGVYVLKVGAIPTGYSDELTRHQEALSVRAFTGRIPPIVESIRNEESYLLLVKIAGQSRIEWRPVVESTELFGSAYEHLASVLWTPQLFSLTDEVAAAKAAFDSLGYQLDETSGGRILPNVREHLLASLLLNDSFREGAVVLPNPVYFALYQHRFQAPRLRLLKGPIHGDCHVKNVFIRPNQKPEVTDLFLIDLGCFRKEGLIGFDQAYFELATLLSVCDGIGWKRWLKLAEVLAQHASPDTQGLHQIERAWAQDVGRGRSTAQALVERDYQDRQDDIRLQFLLANVVAGLSFLHKRPREGSGSGGLTAEQYRSALVWSAVNLKQLLEATECSFEPVQAVMGCTQTSAASDVETPGGDISDEQWNRLSGFDGSGLNVLVIAQNTLSDNSLKEFIQLPWSVVIDFNDSERPGSLFEHAPRSFRQLWPKKPLPDMKLLTRGGLWYYANGRSDISDVPPSPGVIEWRRTYLRSLDDLLRQIAHSRSPSHARVLILTDGVEPTLLRMLCEALDTAFTTAMEPPLVLSKAEVEAPPSISTVHATPEAFKAKLREFAEPRRRRKERIGLIPKRAGKEGVSLEALPDELERRIERDLTVVYRYRAEAITPGRIYGRDFRRGMPIEWCELAQNLDVDRELSEPYRQKIQRALDASTLATVNLLHEPSAGGTTLARRLAWTFMEEYPVVLLNQFSADTSSYLRDVFQFTGLPVLVVMEAEAITESSREKLLTTLREDNTRAVFLWVSRVYRSHSGNDVLPAQLSQAETEEFLTAYIDQVKGSTRERPLRDLASDPAYSDQRSPFFFGLTAFGEDYIGLDRLIEESVSSLTSESDRMLLGELCLVSLYTSSGFPIDDFDKLCAKYNKGRRPFREMSPLALCSETHIRVPHHLIAERAIRGLARSQDQWRADLPSYASGLLGHLRELPKIQSDQLATLIESLFVTRDIESALLADADLQAGGISTRAFSPLIQDIGNPQTARRLLGDVVDLWPDRIHYALHFARHLMYVEPREVHRAIEVGNACEDTEAGSRDDAVVHVAGMAYRVRMDLQLRDARRTGMSTEQVESKVRGDFEQAIRRFERATEMNRASEYGLVATVQTVTKMLRGMMEVRGATNVFELWRKGESKWYLEAFSKAEECIGELRQMPRPDLSLRAQRTIAAWDSVFGKHDSVIATLEQLVDQHEDVVTRRALCDAILVKHRRILRDMPQADLETIARMMERNIEQQGVRDSDVRKWFMAYRRLDSFDSHLAVERMIDWHRINPQAVDPPFYVYVLMFLQWLESTPKNQGYADECRKWVKICLENRLEGQRGWSFEWLAKRGDGYSIINFRDLGFDPLEVLRGRNDSDRERMDRTLPRLSAVLKDYRGPQLAVADLGNGIQARTIPRQTLVKDDEGKRLTVTISFSHDGIIGWDPRLVGQQDL